MQIHKGLLTHDGVAGDTAGKVLDLGFNGDFDIKNHRWNSVFVAFPANGSATAITLTVKTEAIAEFAAGTSYTKDTSLVKYKGCLWKYVGTTGTVAAWDDAKFEKLDLDDVQTAFATADNVKAIGSVEVPAKYAKLGGVWGMPMPRGLGRYLSLAITGADGTVVTAGITDAVDTDVNPGVDWTYFKADTKGVNQPGDVEKQAALVGGVATNAAAISGLDTRVTALEDA